MNKDAIESALRDMREGHATEGVLARLEGVDDDYLHSYRTVESHAPRLFAALDAIGTYDGGDVPTLCDHLNAYRAAFMRLERALRGPDQHWPLSDADEEYFVDLYDELLPDLHAEGGDYPEDVSNAFEWVACDYDHRAVYLDREGYVWTQFEDGAYPEEEPQATP